MPPCFNSFFYTKSEEGAIITHKYIGTLIYHKYHKTKATILQLFKDMRYLQILVVKTHVFDKYTIIIVNFQGLTRMFLYIFILFTMFWIFEENRSLEPLPNW